MLRCYFSTKHCIEGIGENPQEPDGTIKGEDSDGAVTKVPRSFMDMVGLAGVGSGVATMVLTEGHVVTTACLSTIVLAPYAAIQKRTLKGLGGMRGQQNDLRANVNFMYQQNNILYHSINKLGVQVNKLEGVEEELVGIAEAAQTSVNRLVEINNEWRELNAKIKKNLERSVVQQVVSVVVQSDSNRDFTIGPKELEMLVMRLKMIKGIEFDEANFRNAISQDDDGDLKLAEIMKVLRNLLDDDVPEEDNIFHLKPEALLDEKK